MKFDKSKLNLSGITAKFNKFFPAAKTALGFASNYFKKFLSLSKSFYRSRGGLYLKRLVFLFVCISVLAGSVFAVLVYGFGKEDKVTKIAAQIIPFPVAMASFHFVTYDQFLREKNYVHHFYGVTQPEGIDYKEIDKQIYNQLIENRILTAEAKKRNIAVEKSDIGSAIDNIIDQNGGRDKVEKVLSDLYGLNLKQFEGLVRTQLLRAKLKDELIAQVEAEHILITVDKDATQDKIDAAKNKIIEIQKEIQAGLSFEEAAKKYSEDVSTAAQGGKLQAFSPGEMVKEFSDTAFNTKAGEISEPVKSEFGWHLIKVQTKTGTITKSFDDWVKELKDKALVLNLYEI